MHIHEILVLCGLATAGFVCNWLAWRLRVPAILFLLFAGLVAGPAMGWIDPDQLFGELLTPIVSVAVAIILFEGSLTLELSDIRGHGSYVRNLVSLGVVVTWTIAAFAAWWLLGWDPYLAALFGAIVTVSGPTVVMPLLRAVRPTATASSVLRWESILIDPLGAILALLVFDVILAAQSGDGVGHIAVIVGIIIATGSAIGIAGGYLYGLAIRRRLIPDLLREYSALAAVLTIFALAESVQSESGFLAVTLMGIWLANMRDVEIEDILNFKESITLLLIGGLFILLAARVDINNLLGLGWGAVALIALLQFVGGPVRSWLSAAGSGVSWREIVFVGWVFPRGIVAAAVSALFALRLVDMQYPGAERLVPLVFAVIIGTVVLQSLTARPLAKLLGVAEPPPTGLLIIGANPIGLAIGQAVQKLDRRVLVADSHWASIRDARMLGLPVFYGSPVSRYAEEELDLTGIGTMLAVSRQPGLNELASVRFAEELGRDHVFVGGNDVELTHEKHSVSGTTAGRVLYRGSITIDELIEELEAGATLSTTELTSEFDYSDFEREYPDGRVLVAVDASGDLRFPTDDQKFHPAEMWTLIALSAKPREET